MIDDREIRWSRRGLVRHRETLERDLARLVALSRILTADETEPPSPAARREPADG